MIALGRVVLALGFLAVPAAAQVTMDNNALNALGKPTAHHHRRPPVRHPAPVSRAPAVTHPAPREAEPSHPAAVVAPPMPAVPTTPPAILALPPPIEVPVATPAPPPPIPVAADAPGEASAIQNGVRVTFGRERADLNPETVAALQKFAEGVRGERQTSVVISAYAAGSATDPSAPRRLALERALAARAVLLHAGIASPRIYPRTVGPSGDAIPDRVDVVAGPVTQPPTQPPRQPSTQPSAQGHAG